MKITKILLMIVVLGFAVYGVYSLFNGDSSSDIQEASQEVTDDQINGDDPVFDEGGRDLQAQWNSTDDPQLIGTSLAKVLDRDEGLAALKLQVTEFQESNGTDFANYSEEQNQQYSELIRQISEYPVSAFITDDDVDLYLTPRAAELYLEWRAEYYDNEGNQLKPFPEPEDQTQENQQQ